MDSGEPGKQIFSCITFFVSVLYLFNIDLYSDLAYINILIPGGEVDQIILFCGLSFQEYLKEGVCNLSIDEAVQV